MSSKRSDGLFKLLLCAPHLAPYLRASRHIGNGQWPRKYLFGDADDIVETSILQQFVGVFTLSAPKRIGTAPARQATLEVAQEITDTAAQVREAYFTVADAQALELWRQVTLAMEARRRSRSWRGKMRGVTAMLRRAVAWRAWQRSI